MKLSSQIINVRENLDAIEVDVLYEMEHRWKEIERYLSDFLVSQGLDDISAKEMAIWPGMELMSALFYLWDFAQTECYDVVILDTAPTAETLKLLSFPDVSDWYFERMYRFFRRILKLARMTVGRFMDAPLPSEDFLKDLEHLKERMKVVRDLLTNPEITSVRLVVNPERMVINETKRAYTYLGLYNLTVEALVVNKLLPEGMEGYFEEKLREQEHYMEVIHEAFDPLKTFTATQFSTELLGVQSLEKLADMLFGEEDPTVVYSTEKPMDIYEEDGEGILSLKLPFSMKEEVELYKSDDSLLIRVGAYKRSVSLPYTLMGMDVIRAEFCDGRLLLRFRKGE